MTFMTESLIFDIVTIISTIVVLTIAFWKWKLSYWDRVGLPTLSPILFFGDTKDVLLGRLTFGEQFQELYKKLKAKGLKHGGVYLGTRPFYLPTDPEIIKHIWQKDFQHFVNHGNYFDEEADPLSGHLFNLEDAKWKNMRVKLTPTFTSRKMKMMFQTLADCTHGLKDIMDEGASSGSPVDIKEILGRFTTDIIGSVAFGLECNSLKDPNTLFRMYGKKIFELSTGRRLHLFLQFILPERVLHAMKFKVTPSDVETFFMKVIRDTVGYREKNNVYRKDFLHMLIQLKNRGTVTDDEKITEDNGKTGEKALTMNELAAQSFVFFAAGFETSSTTVTFALLELALNQDIQQKLREEINTCLAKSNGELTYQAIMEMTYMDKVLQETLRKYPPVPFLTRRCTKDYTIPETSIKLRKGDHVGISVVGIQNDPEYYPDPEKFVPERFNEENKNSRHPFTWMPFGEGPRICIGLRFGMLQSKVGLAALLKNYKITLNSKTKMPIEMEKSSFITSVNGGVWLNVEKLS
ncbi:cytochrome P450 6BQ6 [Tribolium castaneum]|uniref:Cytochrome P450 6BQ6 n=2 Tax=Tribolium castaneum TaxID=7070 RepID=D2A0A0_TRICA|nr:PREDICTED: probable cytochrome P450 6a14 [Tribolium castaneum]EFA02820.1 cytochrome P450 6BQ6 [Tribolium castaneum]|eukprot:XP_975569.1 PREDICTED: probable cytochrome P450 6a14 [Tribolium castaneum]